MEQMTLAVAQETLVLICAQALREVGTNPMVLAGYILGQLHTAGWTLAKIPDAID